MGIFKFPEEYGDYIQYFGFLASTYSMQLCSCSYKDNLVLGFTSKIPGDSIQRNFLKILKEKGLSYEEVESDFPGYKKEKTNVPAKVFQTFNVSLYCGRHYIYNGKLYGFWQFYVVLGSRSGKFECVATRFCGV